MKTFNESIVKAIQQAYKSASKEEKKIFEQMFSKEILGDKITDRVKTFVDAVIECSYYPPDFDHSLENDEPDEVAYKKLKIIVKALNEGWVPDWNNSNEYKYYPWFDLSGGGFSCDVYDYVCSPSHVGSRLCFKSKELAKYAAIQFQDIY